MNFILIQYPAYSTSSLLSVLKICRMFSQGKLPSFCPRLPGQGTEASNPREACQF
jgi:hypothetical protein